MILKDLYISEGKNSFTISAFVIIKRDNKHYSVPISKNVEYSEGDDYLLSLREFAYTVKIFLEECKKIDEHHIPVKKDQFKDVNFGNTMETKRYLWQNDLTLYEDEIKQHEGYNQKYETSPHDKRKNYSKIS